MSFRMDVLNLPSQFKMSYMVQEGKMDQSVQIEFDRLSKEYDSSRTHYKNDKNVFKDAKEERDKYVASQGLKPLMFDRKYRDLDKKYDQAKENMKMSKDVYKEKLKEYRQIKSQIRQQYRAVKEYEKAQEMYAMITNPQNQKYVNIFPPNNIGAFMQNYQQIYSKDTFSYSQQNGFTGIVHPKNIIDNDGSYQKLCKAYNDCLIQKGKEKARQVANSMKQVARDTVNKVNDNLNKADRTAENEI